MQVMVSEMTTMLTKTPYDPGAVGTSTCWLSALAMASTFDTDLMLEWAEALGEEFYGKGSNVLLGPGIYSSEHINRCRSDK